MLARPTVHDEPTYVPDRPYAPEGLRRRVLPFLTVVPVAAAWMVVDLHDKPRTMLALAALAAIVIAPIFLVPWSRLPRWTDSIPPLLGFVVILALNEATSSPGSSTSFAPLALLPVFWIALYGSRFDLVIAVFASAAMVLLPPLVHPHLPWVPALTRASLWAVITASLGWSTQSLVAGVRDDWRRTAGIVATSHEAFVGLDESGIVTDWNPAAELLFGWSSAEMVGRRFSEHVVPPALRDRHDLALRLFAESGHGGGIVGRRIEMPARHKGGWEISVELTISAQRRGERWTFHAFLHDVSARHRDERRRQHYAEQLERINDELRKADELKTHFLAMASHELRTPLTSIGGFAETMLRMWDELADADKREYVGIMDTQAQRLVRLVNDLLLITRIEGGKLETEPTDVPVHETVQRCLVELALERDVEVDCTTALRTWADADHLQQILVNFVTNAQRYGAGPLRIEASDNGDEVRFAVIDHGPGVPAEFVPHLFERFAQAGRSTTRTIGTGLGLSIVRGLARAQGGDAWYEPNAPHGSRFVVCLPMAHTMQRADEPVLDAST
jgi:PAS domain S-box-containing protein